MVHTDNDVLLSWRDACTMSIKKKSYLFRWAVNPHRGCQKHACYDSPKRAHAPICDSLSYHDGRSSTMMAVKPANSRSFRRDYLVGARKQTGMPNNTRTTVCTSPLLDCCDLLPMIICILRYLVNKSMKSLGDHQLFVFCFLMPYFGQSCLCSDAIPSKRAGE